MGRRLERGDGNSWQCIALQQKMARLQPGGRDSPWSIADPLPHTFVSPAPVHCDPRPRVRLQNTNSDGKVYLGPGEKSLACGWSTHIGAAWLL